MILYHRTSILNSNAKVTVNTVNCVGVMGKGLAQAYKRRYPDMFKQYKSHCKDGLLEPGKLWLWKAEDQWVLNFPTKIHWKNPSKIEWIEKGLEKFAQTYDKKGITQISFPKLGCGNGGLNWESEVKPLMEQKLGKLPLEIWIHDYEVPIGIPEHIEQLSSERNLRTLPTSNTEFWNQLRATSRHIGTKLTDFETKEPFRINTQDDLVIMDSGRDRTFYTKDEMIDAWKILSRGLLTKHKLGLSNSSEASKVVSIFGSMPFAMPVEVKPSKSISPEIAAQLKASNKPRNTPSLL